VLKKSLGILEQITVGEVPLDVYLWHISRYMFVANFLEESKVILDVACGTGYGSYYLARRHTGEIIGIDISERAIGYAREKYHHNNLSFVKGDAVNLPFTSNSFDMLISFETIEHLQNYEKFLFERNSRLLKRNVLFIISTSNKKVSILKRLANPFHCKEFFKEEFVTLPNVYFKLLALFGQRFFRAGALGKRSLRANILSKTSRVLKKLKNTVKKSILLGKLLGSLNIMMVGFQNGLSSYYSYLYHTNIKKFEKKNSEKFLSDKYKIKLIDGKIKSMIPEVLIAIVKSKK
jgi:ubiquinone/menaquinone biosynthesis C-methylase UbiE